MFHSLFQKLKKKTQYKNKDINPDEIFIDATNIPSFNRDQFEGRIEKPIKKSILIVFKLFFVFVLCVFVFKAFSLQIMNGGFYFDRSIKNNLKKEVIFAHRGIITDRNDTPIAWNEDNQDMFDKRIYTDKGGFSNIIGYVKYPGQDAKGNFYSYNIEGQDGVEKYFNEALSGVNGAKLTEVSVKGEIESQGTLEPPQNGAKLALSIDAGVQNELYREILDAAEKSGFTGGAGVIMDIKTGEVLASASYPEFDANIMTEGTDKKAISTFLQSKRQPFLDRVASGLYTPGSIVKPFIALGVLQEKLIDPFKQIFTVGYLSLPNPYDKSHPTIFKDWKDHGYVDLRKAIAISSDVYFYIVGGGFGDQKGLGISKIDEYLSKFLFGTPISGFFAGPKGLVPTPEWKKQNFNGEDWTVGNTYHTAIGQYGFQVTPIQIARAMSGIANEGTLVEPVIIKGEQGAKTTISGIDKGYYNTVKEGMRRAVTEGTAIALNIPDIKVGAKTGTAELGSAKQRVNSWVAGFFPYDNPRYSFALVLENGPTTYQISAMRAMGATVKWMKENNLDYVKE